MVESKVLSFVKQLDDWLVQTPGNVVISFRGNSTRPIRKVFENLSLAQVLRLARIIVYLFMTFNSRISEVKAEKKFCKIGRGCLFRLKGN